MIKDILYALVFIVMGGGMIMVWKNWRKPNDPYWNVRKWGCLVSGIVILIIGIYQLYYSLVSN